MNEQERHLLIADLKAEIIKELTGMDLRSTPKDEPKPLKEVYDNYREQLYQKFGTVTWAQAWESVRKLAVFKMGKRYVRDLLPSEEQEAAEFAEMMINQLLDDPS